MNLKRSGDRCRVWLLGKITGSSLLAHFRDLPFLGYCLFEWGMLVSFVQGNSTLGADHATVEVTALAA